VIDISYLSISDTVLFTIFVCMLSCKIGRNKFHT
jgi:hypothetical protein